MRAHLPVSMRSLCEPSLSLVKETLQYSGTVGSVYTLLGCNVGFKHLFVMNRVVFDSEKVFLALHDHVNAWFSARSKLAR